MNQYIFNIIDNLLIFNWYSVFIYSSYEPNIYFIYVQYWVAMNEYQTITIFLSKNSMRSAGETSVDKTGME